MKANQRLKEFKSDENAAVGMIIMGALILVLSIIIIPVFYRIASSTDTTSIDADLQSDTINFSNTSTPSANATDDILSIGNSVMSLNPLAALVAVAGGIIGILLSVLSPKMFAGAGI